MSAVDAPRHDAPEAQQRGSKFLHWCRDMKVSMSNDPPPPPRGGAGRGDREGGGGERGGEGRVGEAKHLFHGLLGREGNAQDGAHDLAEFYYLRHAAFQYVNGHCKAHSCIGPRRRIDGCVDSCTPQDLDLWGWPESMTALASCASKTNVLENLHRNHTQSDGSGSVRVRRRGRSTYEVATAIQERAPRVAGCRGHHPSSAIKKRCQNIAQHTTTQTDPIREAHATRSSSKAGRPEERAHG